MTTEQKTILCDYWYSLQDYAEHNLPEGKRVELEHFICEVEAEERARIGAEVSKKFWIHKELASQWTGIRLDGVRDACNPHLEQMDAYKTVLDIITHLTTPREDNNKEV